MAIRHFVRRCRWAHAPSIHAASHVDHKKRVVSVFILMHGWDPVPIVMVLRLAALRYQCKEYRVNYAENQEPMGSSWIFFFNAISIKK